MKDIPIIFSAPMVRSLLDGRKTMTRRLAWRSETDIKKMSFVCDGERPDPLSKPSGAAGIQMAGRYWLRPTHWVRAKPGDKLWVRETWFPANSDNGPVLLTKADYDRRYLVDESYPVDYDKFSAGRAAWSAWAGDVESGSTKAWRSPIHMPRWASRLTLVVTATKIERLQNISEDDAKAEGIDDAWLVAAHAPPPRVHEFRRLWEDLHGDGAWARNPDVVVLLAAEEGGSVILPAQTIRRIQPITPFFERTVANGITFGLGPAGYDVRVAEELILPRGAFSLASTVERFEMPDDVLAYVKDKSTWARRGVCVQNTVIEPGWCGHLTLEITNHHNLETITIRAGDPIAQIIFHRLEEPTDAPYRGKYQNQQPGPQPARSDPGSQ